MQVELRSHFLGGKTASYGTGNMVTHAVTYFTFMGLCIIYVFKQNQHDATLNNGIYYHKCSTCFRSSKLYTLHRVFVKLFLFLTTIVSEFHLTIAVRSRKKLDIFMLLLLSWVSSNSPTIPGRSRKSSTNIRCCVYSFELLMMDGGTAGNM